VRVGDELLAVVDDAQVVEPAERRLAAVGLRVEAHGLRHGVDLDPRRLDGRVRRVGVGRRGDVLLAERLLAAGERVAHPDAQDGNARDSHEFRHRLARSVGAFQTGAT
jgi:hypothetical protein